MPAPNKRKRTHTPRPRPRKDGTVAWQVRYTIVRNGKTVATSQVFDDEVAAIRWAALLDRLGPDRAEAILSAQLAAEAEAELTIAAWLRRYVDRLTGIEPATRKRYHRFIDLDVVGFFGEHAPLKAYTEELDAAWVLWLEHDVCHKPGARPGNAPKTIRNKHGFMSEAMAAAARHRPEPLVPANPCANTRLPRVNGRRREFFTPAEFELFEALLWPKYRPMFEFMVMSMCRPGEVFALTVGDVDVATGAVTIDKAWKYADGKRVLGPPKSERGARTVHVPLETLARIDLDRPANELLFPTGVGTAFTVVGFYKQIWLPAVRRLEALGDEQEPGRNLFGRMARWEGETPAQLLARFGRDTVVGLLAKWLTPYITRHTGISWRLQDGVPIWVVSRDAGHESVTTTDRKYGHIDSRASVAAAELVGGRLPVLRSNVVGLEMARRRRAARAGLLGEIDKTGEGFEAIWMDAAGIVHSQLFDNLDAAVEHIALHEVDEPADEPTEAAA
ncbi:tyrosine-type recombinase/integrase [Nocardia cyriacigeorgica]|uniref:tyrosine-type recombinase/integrase n=1 Tax=Nocardia cyriacigeorgica TaxID=135487 RepID=UPI0013D02BF8|nr:site-specific integrase [Nocardia cyriacigeorgica]NEW27287.1 site-specific integrase [Nocardia cyriacigeorgica]